MDRPSQRPGEPTPESLYVGWLARRRDGEEVEFEEVCLARSVPSPSTCGAAPTVRDARKILPA